MKKIIIVTVILIVVYFGYTYFTNTNTAEAPSLTDTTFTETLEYSCAGGKTLQASFGDKVARVTLSEGVSYTLEQISIHDEDGTKFANDGDQIVFWVKDQSAFLLEGGTETYSACRTQ